MTLPRRIRIAVPLAVAAAALSVTSLAFACTVMRGQTYADPAANGGGALPAFADGIGGATPANGTLWVLTANKNRGPCHSGDTSLAASATLDRSRTPDLGPVIGIAPLSAGRWNVCFLRPDASVTGGGYSTWPAIVTVL